MLNCNVFYRCECILLTIMADVCIIHCCEAKDQVIKELKDDTWEKILKCAAVYLGKPDSKYHFLSKGLPKSRSGGYHSSCYKRFTAIHSSATISTTPTPSTSSADICPKTDTMSAASKATDSRPTSPHLRGASIPTTDSSSEGFDDVCLFCNKKCIKVNQKKQHLTTCTLESAETFIKDLIQKQSWTL